MDAQNRMSSTDWPCQRVRLALGALLFVTFELVIGRQLPLVLTFMVFGLGVACAVSSAHAIRTHRLHAQVARVRSAFDHRR